MTPTSLVTTTFFVLVTVGSVTITVSVTVVFCVVVLNDSAALRVVPTSSVTVYFVVEVLSAEVNVVYRDSLSVTVIVVVTVKGVTSVLEVGVADCTGTLVLIIFPGTNGVPLT